MKPVNFKQQNKVFGKDQDQYKNLPAYINPNSQEGEVVSCWRLNLLERLILLFTGRVYLSLWTFKKPIQPSYLTVHKSQVLPSKKIALVLMLFLCSTAMFSQGIKFANNEDLTLSYLVDPTLNDRGAQLIINLRKGLNAGWVGAEVSIYPELKPAYLDFVASGGIRLTNIWEDYIVYAGPRLGRINRGGVGFNLVGGVIGFDLKVFEGVYFSTRIWVDYREDLLPDAYGDSDVPSTNLIFKGQALRENGAIGITVKI